MRYFAKATPSAVPFMVINLSFAWEGLSSSIKVIMAPVICLKVGNMKNLYSNVFMWSMKKHALFQVEKFQDNTSWVKKWHIIQSSTDFSIGPQSHNEAFYTKRLTRFLQFKKM